MSYPYGMGNDIAAAFDNIDWTQWYSHLDWHKAGKGFYRATVGVLTYTAENIGPAEWSVYAMRQQVKPNHVPGMQTVVIQRAYARSYAEARSIAAYWHGGPNGMADVYRITTAAKLRQGDVIVAVCVPEIDGHPMLPVPDLTVGIRTTRYGNLVTVTTPDLRRSRAFAPSTPLQVSL